MWPSLESAHVPIRPTPHAAWDQGHMWPSLESAHVPIRPTPHAAWDQGRMRPWSAAAHARLPRAVHAPLGWTAHAPSAGSHMCDPEQARMRACLTPSPLLHKAVM
jgi:hypothetical protein